ncbi:MAG TPA: CvpA family protein [Desulfuromonadaceae bacterium]|nr:CvpA family protein [Desulfuromonadaceae bacterium]
MIAAAAAAKPGSPDVPFNWFDMAVILIILFGFYRGRRNGMSKECLPLLQWLILVPLCAFVYPIAGQCYINFFKWDKLAAYVAGYVTLAAVVLIFFSILKKLFSERMANSDGFKRGEYVLGMFSGVTRMVCIIIVFLALLNAPVYTQQDIQKRAAYVKETYGGGTYSGDYFPTVQEVQNQVFNKSFIGAVARNNIGMLLINGVDKKTTDAPKPKVTSAK